MNVIYLERFTGSHCKAGETEYGGKAIPGKAASNLRIRICNVGKIELIARAIEQQDGDALPTPHGIFR